MSDSMVMPAGKYWIGDPCYIFPNDGPMADKWLPNSCCVMDVASVKGKKKVIEVRILECEPFVGNVMNDYLSFYLETRKKSALLKVLWLLYTWLKNVIHL